MKHLILLFVIILSLASCKKKNTDTETLPPATQTGANTFGCYVNGQLFTTSGKYLIGGNTSNCATHHQVYFGIDTVLSIFAKKDGPRKRMDLSIEYHKGMMDFVMVHDYPFEAIYSDYSNGTIPNGNNTFGLDSANKIYVHLTKYEAKGICAGTFYGTMVNSNGNVISITDGRFDLSYQFINYNFAYIDTLAFTDGD